MAPSSVKTFGVKEAIAELCTAAADFQQKASSTVVLKSEFAKVGQVVKKLGLLQEDWQNTCDGIQNILLKILAAVSCLCHAMLGYLMCYSLCFLPDDMVSGSLQSVSDVCCRL